MMIIIIIIIKGHSLRRACLHPATSTQNSKPRPPTTNARSKGKLETALLLLQLMPQVGQLLPQVGQVLGGGQVQHCYCSSYCPRWVSYCPRWVSYWGVARYSTATAPANATGGSATATGGSGTGGWAGTALLLLQLLPQVGQQTTDSGKAGGWAARWTACLSEPHAAIRPCVNHTACIQGEGLEVPLCHHMSTLPTPS